LNSPAAPMAQIIIIHRVVRAFEHMQYNIEIYEKDLYTSVSYDIHKTMQG
jgi:hypothetical protein